MQGQRGLLQALIRGRFMQGHARPLVDRVHQAPISRGIGVDLKRELRRLIELAGFAPPLSLRLAAHKLAMTPRTLQRHLSLEGLHYRRVLNDVRLARALMLLSRPGSTIERVAIEVGFSEPSAFHRAFKRWTRSAPGEFRRAQRREHG
jgi:AraC-like DNA-binding protein